MHLNELLENTVAAKEGLILSNGYAAACKTKNVCKGIEVATLCHTYKITKRIINIIPETMHTCNKQYIEHRGVIQRARR